MNSVKLAQVMAEEAKSAALEIGAKGSLEIFNHAKGAISVRANGQYLDLSWSPKAADVCVETLSTLLA